MQKISLLQVIYCFFYIIPAGVLGKHRAYHNLEGRITRPPVLRAEMAEKLLVDQFQFMGH